MYQRHTLASAEARIPSGQRWVTIFKHGPNELEFYAPRGTDPQQPHTRDETYFIAAGSASFVSAGKRESCRAGDVFFVPAGTLHHFEDISDDFATWAIFSDAR